MDNMYVQYLIQWVFFIALVSIVIIPALRFRKIAMEHGKKGWLFMLVGFATGVLALQAGRLMAYLLMQLPASEEYHPYFAVALVIVGYIVVFVTTNIFRKTMGANKS